MWKFCKYVRTVRSQIRDVFDFNRHPFETTDGSSSRSVVKCRLQSWYEETGSNDEKTESSKGTWKKHSECPSSDIGDFLGAVGWGSALFVGAQYIWSRHSVKDERPRNRQWNEYCLWHMLPTATQYIGFEPVKLSILPDSNSGEKPSSSEEPTQPRTRSRSLSSPIVNDTNWEVEFNAPQHVVGELDLENKTEVDEVQRILPLCDELVTAANQCVSVIQNKIGLQLAAEKQSSKALSFFKAACDLGDSKACFNVGVCYETGLGTRKDLDKAREFYQQAADLGHASAMYNLGVYCLEGRGGEAVDRSRGFQLMESAAELGVLEAERYMAMHYLETEETDKAVPFLKAAVEKKDVDSQFYLGLCYENGWGVNENLAKAADLYSRSASQGHVEASYNLGVFHELGLGGLPRDEETAEEWYSKAAVEGNRDAQLRLEEMKRNRTVGSTTSWRNSFSFPEIGSTFFGSNLIPVPSTGLHCNEPQPYHVFCEDMNSHPNVGNVWGVRRSSVG